MGQGQMLGNICTLEQIHGISISREFLSLTEWLCPSQTGLPSSPPLENYCPMSQTLTLFQHVLWYPFNSEVFPGKRAAHCAPDLVNNPDSLGHRVCWELQELRQMEMREKHLRQ